MTATGISDIRRIELIAELVVVMQQARSLGLPSAAYSRPLREFIHFAWERRKGSKYECADFISRACRAAAPDTAVRYDHAVPFRILRDQLLELETVTPEAVERLLRRLNVAALITPDEDALLTTSGLRQKMPDGWDRIDPLARYNVVGIEVVDRTGL